jgi:hypothetical protein
MTRWCLVSRTASSSPSAPPRRKPARYLRIRPPGSTDWSITPPTDRDNMPYQAKALLYIATLASATPVDAQAPAPTTTRFDGKYLGISAELLETGGISHLCRPEALLPPPPLTIMNGVVTGPWEGTVSRSGAITIKTRHSLRVEAQMDPQGTIRGQDAGHGGHNACYTRFRVAEDACADDSVRRHLCRRISDIGGDRGPDQWLRAERPATTIDDRQWPRADTVGKARQSRRIRRQGRRTGYAGAKRLPLRWPHRW